MKLIWTRPANGYYIAHATTVLYDPANDEIWQEPVRMEVARIGTRKPPIWGAIIEGDNDEGSPMLAHNDEPYGSGRDAKAYAIYLLNLGFELTTWGWATPTEDSPEDAVMQEYRYRERVKRYDRHYACEKKPKRKARA